MGYFGEALVPTLQTYFLDAVFPRFIEIMRVPIDNKEVLWALAPLIITLLLIQIYFGRHRQEDIGWNTAYGNCIVLIFVVANLGRYVYERYGLDAILVSGTEAFYKAALVGAMCLVALSLFFLDFFHSISKRISFFLCSSISITFFAFVSIVGVYSTIPFDRDTLVTALLFFIILWAFFRIFRSIVPPSEEAERYLEKKQEERHQGLLEKKKKLKHEIQSIKERIGL